jgi:hypothetical protein
VEAVEHGKVDLLVKENYLHDLVETIYYLNEKITEREKKGGYVYNKDLTNYN